MRGVFRNHARRGMGIQVNIETMDGILSQIFRRPEPEYGNDQACSNCGDEWSTNYDETGLCDDCQTEKNRQ